VIVANADLNSISPDRIASIEVIKGPAAVALYPNNPAATNGVIKVTLKK
jgi:outer membrane receptor protein involved in Fe transport